MEKLIDVFLSAPEIEKQALIATFVSGANTDNSTYQGLKLYDAEKKAEAEKAAEYQRGYQMRDEAAAKFNKMYPNT